ALGCTGPPTIIGRPGVRVLLHVSGANAMVNDHLPEGLLARPAFTIVGLGVFMEDALYRQFLELWLIEHQTGKQNRPFAAAGVAAAFVVVTAEFDERCQVNPVLDESNQQLALALLWNIKMQHQRGLPDNADNFTPIRGLV